MNKEEVLKLANLSRVEIQEAEAEKLSQEFNAILNYVGEIQNAKVGSKEKLKENFPLRNVLREDSDVHESGLYTEALLAEAPARQDGFVKVKKIL